LKGENSRGRRPEKVALRKTDLCFHVDAEAREGGKERRYPLPRKKKKQAKEGGRSISSVRRRRKKGLSCSILVFGRVNCKKDSSVLDRIQVAKKAFSGPDGGGRHTRKRPHRKSQNNGFPSTATRGGDRSKKESHLVGEKATVIHSRKGKHVPLRWHRLGLRSDFFLLGEGTEEVILGNANAPLLKTWIPLSLISGEGPCLPTRVTNHPKGGMSTRLIAQYWTTWGDLPLLARKGKKS